MAQMSHWSYTMWCSSWNLERISCLAVLKEVYFQRHGNRLQLDPKRTQWLMLGRQAPPRNLAIRHVSSHGTASASTFLLDEWPILNFVFEVDFLLSSKREAFFVSSLKAQPSPKLTNNVLGYVLTEQFPNGSRPDQVCSRRTISFMSICSHGTGTEKQG